MNDDWLMVMPVIILMTIMIVVIILMIDSWYIEYVSDWLMIFICDLIRSWMARIDWWSWLVRIVWLVVIEWIFDQWHWWSWMMINCEDWLMIMIIDYDEHDCWLWWLVTLLITNDDDLWVAMHDDYGWWLVIGIDWLMMVIWKDTVF